MSDQINHAKQLYARGQLAEAERAFSSALDNTASRKEALEFLSMIYLQLDRPPQALSCLQQLVQLYPDDPLYSDRLASLLDGRGDGEEAVQVYQRLLERRPELVDTRYNLARLLRTLGRYRESLIHYYQALDEGISEPEELYSNIASIYSKMHREDDAREALRQALECKKNYIPALYNLGLLEEEHGHWSTASELFQTILGQDPNHIDALLRLIHGQKVQTINDPLLAELQRVLTLTPEQPRAQEDLNFGLGKGFDDCGNYEFAFEHYQTGNSFSQGRMGKYDRVAQESTTAQLMTGFSSQSLREIKPVSEAEPVFICGMYRSGTTLVEQMLASHPDIVAGGEIRFFERESLRFTSMPKESDRQKLAQQYLDLLQSNFPGAARVTNKMPDNFLYLGLIKALFPKVRIIHTQRNILDNCLSIYFQQISGKQRKYGNDLMDIAHYYAQYRKLMGHWLAILDSNIISVNYEDIVSDPEAKVREVLQFLGLEWHPACMDFQQVNNRVQTASYWQVRQSLYSSSIARSNNYQMRIGEMEQYFRSLNLSV
jgi:tetratricopeptide (TPR) repeat protein